MRKTVGEIYRENKSVHDKHAEQYLDEHLTRDGDVCYFPFTMKTYYTRTLIKRISANEYHIFNGYVKDIADGDTVGTLTYNGEIAMDKGVQSKKRAIELCGFEFGCNPHSSSNRELQQLEVA